MKDVEEGRIKCIDQKDIFTLSLGTPEHPVWVRGKGGKKKPKQFFNTAKPLKAAEENECEEMLREKGRMLEEEIVYLETKKKQPPTPHSEVSSTNIRKQMLQHEKIQGKAHCKDHVEDS